jgi:hypothetical protein
VLHVGTEQERPVDVEQQQHEGAAYARRRRPPGTLERDAIAAVVLDTVGAV